MWKIIVSTFLLLMIGFLVFSYKTRDQLYLPRLNNDSYCMIDPSNVLEDLDQDKLVVYLSFEREKSTGDFHKWVALSDHIASKLSIKTIFYVHYSDCNPGILNPLRNHSLVEDNTYIFLDKDKEFLSVNGLADVMTYSALLDHSNNVLVATDKDYYDGIMGMYQQKVAEVLDIDLPYVDGWSDPTIY